MNLEINLLRGYKPLSILNSATIAYELVSGVKFLADNKFPFGSFNTNN